MIGTHGWVGKHDDAHRALAQDLTERQNLILTQDFLASQSTVRAVVVQTLRTDPPRHRLMELLSASSLGVLRRSRGREPDLVSCLCWLSDRDRELWRLLIIWVCRARARHAAMHGHSRGYEVSILATSNEGA